MVNKTVLPNGIRILSQSIPHAHSVSIGVWVVGGSRHEDQAHNGISHLIEHLLFKGTERRSSFEIAREVDSVGGFLNAFTGREFVCYYAKVLIDYLPKAVDLLSDIFLNSRFPEEELENERKVILQEIRMIEDTPDDYLHDLFYRSIWKGHQLGMPIIGTEESVGGFTRDFIVTYRNSNYLADDIIISVAGNVDHKKVVSMLSEHFADVPSGSGRQTIYPPQYAKNCLTAERDLEQVLFCLGARALPQNHPKRHEAMVLNTLLGGSMSSRLFQEVREKEGLAYSIYSYLMSHTDTGVQVVSTGTTVEKFPEVMEIVMREMKRLKTEPVPEDLLTAAREQLKGSIMISLESNDNVMSKLAKNEIYYGAYQPVEEIMKGFDRVTAKGLQELSNEIFDARYVTLQLLGKTSSINFDTSDISF